MAKKKLPAAKILENALQRLSRKQVYLKRFSDLEDWIEKEDNTILNKELPYLEQIKNIILREYWEKDIFISPPAVDDIVFFCVREYPKDEILKEVRKAIEINGLTNESVVIFPLTNFGFKYGGIGRLIGLQAVNYTLDDFSIYSQTNSYTSSKKNINNYINEIRLPNAVKLNYSLFDHFYTSRNLKWLEANPVLLLHFNFNQQEKFDNIRFIIEKINCVTTKLYFLSTFSNEEDGLGALFSTSTTNNFETNDIYHFLTVTSTAHSCVINCVPIHYSQLELYELMNMNVDLLFKKGKGPEVDEKIINAIEILHSGHLQYLINKDKKSLKFHRISNSLNYFRRAVKFRRLEDKIININIALECLLLDERRVPKKKTILQRLSFVFKGDSTIDRIMLNVENVINERNRIVHAGLPVSDTPDLHDIYTTYCKTILFFAKHIDEIDSEVGEYISKFFARYKSKKCWLITLFQKILSFFLHLLKIK